jgi:hypothetical protein
MSVAAFTHFRNAANEGARMSFVCGRPLAENPWPALPMRAVASHLPPRPKGDPNAPGMFAFSDPVRVSEIVTAAVASIHDALEPQTDGSHVSLPGAMWLVSSASA